MVVRRSTRLLVETAFLAAISLSGLTCDGDLDPMQDPCKGVTCSSRGQCQVRNGSAVCVCEAGYRAEGLECVEDCQPDCSGKSCGDDDGCGGRCTDCPDGQVCDQSAWSCCTPDCEGRCGGSDHCGGTCPDNCVPPDTCGGGGVPDVCGCTPATCEELGKNCGAVSDGCGGTLECGTCTEPEVCGWGGANVCGENICSDDHWCWENPRPQGNDLNSVWGTGPDDIWAVGDMGIVLRWNGAYWTPVYSGSAKCLNGIWGSGQDDIWAVGNEGTILEWKGSEWSVVPMVTTVNFAGVWGITSDDVWVVGGSTDCSDLPCTSQFGIVHWDGTSWSEVATGTGYELYGVWGIGPDDIWAVGCAGAILHWNGTAWSEVSSGKDYVLEAIWGTGPDDVWAIGGVEYCGTAVLHWNGIAWSEMSMERLGVGLHGVWGTGLDNVWVAGYWSNIMHWNGSDWEIMEMNGSYFGHLKSIWGSEPDDIWAVGDKGKIIHWDGIEWSSVLGGTPCLEPIDGNFHNIDNIEAIWGSGLNDIWAVGGGHISVDMCSWNDGGYWGGILMHWNGIAWTADWNVNYLKGIWGTSSDDVWSVGYGSIRHWDGTYWLPVSSQCTQRGIWGSGPDDIWAVGDSTTIGWLHVLYHWDGEDWRWNLDVRDGYCLNGIWGSGPDDIWAVGGDECKHSIHKPSSYLIMHWNGTDWTEVDTGLWPDGTDFGLFGVWSSGPDDVWAVGSAGTIMYWNGIGWPWVQFNTDHGFNAVWGSGPEDVFVVGDGGTILHWDGTDWSSMSSGTSNNLDAVWGIGPNEFGRYDVFAAGENSTILRYRL